ncbi:hypothetical protein NGF19_07925 [Streptomyces sp. RY43-2]|uniref:Uncharacterized protein n=1 Tax=Streptomyces macrolidinus TaxID=2952607 RepID=A0ABT0ZAD3_9ACTN|nr:hypothetical protein [Streptomyces macrolidinus]MCN9240725.1 hypothetical protein [Streptomyces macrolidinus]
MERPQTTALTVTVGDVRTEDVIAVGGILRTVVDMRDIVGDRKKLEFDDRNFLILPRNLPIAVTRRIPRSPAPARRHARSVRAATTAARFVNYRASAR